MKWSLLSIIFIIGCGVLGGFEHVKFDVNKERLSEAIDSLYKEYPQYIIPRKWDKYDDWTERGFDFLDSRIFYFNTPPEEMYYVTIIADTSEQPNPFETEIAIRAVSMGNKRWLKKDDFNSQERERIMERFNVEIVSKLNWLIK